MKKTVVFLLALTLAACLIAACNQQPGSAPPGENCSLPEMAGGELCPEEALCDDAAHEAAEAPPQNEFVSSVQIHEDMPAFTITRIVGGYVMNPLSDIPNPKEVSIIIKNNEGDVVQVISDLTQSGSHTQYEIIFEDYNFDGFLDMRLLRWREGTLQRNTANYFWLWNSEASQFIFNEQLVGIGITELHINQEAQQIVAWLRADMEGHLVYFYEFHDDELVLIGYEYVEIEWIQ